MYRFPRTANEQLKHRTNCRQIVGAQREVRQTSKTKKRHATAIINDERGKLLPAIVGNTARGASEPAKPGKRKPLPCRRRAGQDGESTSGAESAQPRGKS